MDKIKNVAQRLGIITVEDMERYTALELIMLIANKMNDYSDELHDLSDKVHYLLNEGTLAEVIQIFDEWLQDGTFDTLLNESVLKKVNDRIDETNAQLSQDKKELGARIDSIIALPDGATTADAELIDIRISNDGIKYKSAGASVREQFNTINDEVDLKLNRAEIFGGLSLKTVDITDFKPSENIEFINYTLTQKQARDGYIYPCVYIENENLKEISFVNLIDTPYVIYGSADCYGEEKYAYNVFQISQNTLISYILKDGAGLEEINRIENINQIINAGDYITLKLCEENKVSFTLKRDGVTLLAVNNIPLTLKSEWFSEYRIVGGILDSNTSTPKNLLSHPRAKIYVEKSLVIPSYNGYYSEKTGRFVGDSITEGVHGSYPYIPYVMDIMNLKNVNNQGLGGASVGFLNGDRLKNITEDFCCFFAGTNDFGVSETEIGTLEDAKKYDNSKFYGSVMWAIRSASEYSQNTPFFMITPLPRFDKKINSKGYTLEDYVNVILELCNIYSIPCLDLYHNSGINEFNKDIYLQSDYLHLKEAGALKVAHKISNFIESIVF